MNRLTIIFITLAILASCGYEKNNSNDNVSSEALIDSIETKDSVNIPTDIISYFKEFKGDAIKIEVENYTQEHRFKPSECLPLSFLPVLDNKIPQTQSESTGAKPVGKIRVNDGNYFLVVVQQDDYGPIYYGLTYNSEENRVQKSEKIAENWGDAGDSQVTYSIVTLKNQIIKIDKYIETCHADLEVQGDEMVATDVECADSTAVVEMKIK